jgi:hypothetical protein
MIRDGLIETNQRNPVKMKRSDGDGYGRKRRKKIGIGGTGN